MKQKRIFNLSFCQSPLFFLAVIFLFLSTFSISCYGQVHPKVGLENEHPKVHSIDTTICNPEQTIKRSPEVGNHVILAQSEIISVYDGDTFKVSFSSLPKIFGEEISIRLVGVDTPEIRTKCIEEKQAGYRAKEFTKEKLRNAQKVELRQMKRGKYFRLLAEVYVDDQNLSELIIQAGHGQSYDGGTRQRLFCKS